MRQALGGQDIPEKIRIRIEKNPIWSNLLANSKTTSSDLIRIYRSAEAQIQSSTIKLASIQTGSGDSIFAPVYNSNTGEIWLAEIFMPQIEESVIINEWEASQAAQSPHLIRYEHTFMFEDTMKVNHKAIVMPYYPGTIQDILSAHKGNPLNPKIIYQLALSLLHAIISLHKAGLVHCNIKPSPFLTQQRTSSRTIERPLYRFPPRLHKASIERTNAYKCFAEDYQTEHRRRSIQCEILGESTIGSFGLSIGLRMSRRLRDSRSNGETISSDFDLHASPLLAPIDIANRPQTSLLEADSSSTTTPTSERCTT
ncbi:hypothetical protein PROFUN_16565 [Planoprotostelium fungivorum]|uniref:Protein kinase domain-containing protein n=1 Tax=Planoprotostelium fungivorum TaxID=1890364 RepID=A0A2P6MQ22_9EUKA|nr:hypothetical protein PROFUN_16565 [Planoprotostelium fungivorum]